MRTAGAPSTRGQAALLLALLAVSAPAQESAWRRDALFQRLAARLDPIAAIDDHTHLLEPGRFDPALDPTQPLLLRSTNPALLQALAGRFGVRTDQGVLAATKSAAAARAARLERLGAAGYWNDHLDATRTSVALVNQSFPEGTDSRRMRWVPYASHLLYPHGARDLIARNAGARDAIAESQTALTRFLGEAGLEGAPAELQDYLKFVDDTLTRWRDSGAVAVKIREAYLRDLSFEDVPETRARALYAKGATGRLTRVEHLAVQDFIARRIFKTCGTLGLPVHVHAGYGTPPYLQLDEGRVTRLEGVLTDPRLQRTRFVLIHGGMPHFHDGAYQGMRPNVWVDLSAMGFLFPVPDLAAIFRVYLLACPEKLLFGTDAAAYPGIPVGPEVQHAVLSLATREALSLALAGLVRDGVLDVEAAVHVGQDVLRGNAERLYGWEPRR